ncbi:protein abrupt-like isoform X1 [Euwallacea similis]|uniref:protein abrupt-like isoform X1 n=2 Tax=Euwallacea similis TaxID=1736056 RepID=UPI00344B7816
MWFPVRVRAERYIITEAIPIAIIPSPVAMAQSQQYCLRWNNHRTNLLSVFDELLQSESFTDVTLACEGGSPIKAHRMVLAACSPYFQNIFTDLPCKHPVVVLKDVKYSEIKAILEYMYRGEVNVAQDRLAALLKVAEALKVKGLVEENRACKTEKEDPLPQEYHSPSSMPVNSNSIASNSVHSSSSNSPPHSTSSVYKSSYNAYDRKHQEHSHRMNLPIWAVPGLPLPSHNRAALPSQSHPHAAATAAAAMLSSAYEAVNSDMSPLKRKKLSSLLMQRDTPILRTVLGQGQPESPQPVSLVCHPDSANMSASEERVVKHMKNEPSEDAQSPYTAEYTESVTDEEDKSKLAIPSSSPQSSSHDMRTNSGIATYVPSQRPEWKRYKQYTRNDIMSAIEAVRNGTSALQAAKHYGVPSRTLYDKVKKLGITTSRPFKRGSNGTSPCFPYSSTSPYRGQLSEGEETMNNNTALLEASTFLQHALDRGGDEREALAAMAAAAAAHAVVSGHSTSPNNMQARSPSPSPTILKYMRHCSLTPSPAPGSDYHHSDQTNGSSEKDRDDDEDQVEDLSVNRKHEPMIESRVIMPPMNQVSAIMKKEEMLIHSVKEDLRREMRVESDGN